VTRDQIKFAAGLIIIAAVIVLRATKLLEWQDAQILLGIAAALLGIIGLLRGNGKK
jgi:hypothetical protein